MNSISSDSGLDIAGPASRPPLRTTRLSWFLAEVDEGSFYNGVPSGKKFLSVLHSMELMENDISDKYMTRIVTFRANGYVSEAKLILASDDRRVVDAALLTMSQEQRDADNDAQSMLVQYTEDNELGNCLVHKIVSPHNVVWLSTKPELGGTPLVKLSQGCIAHVLHAYERRDCMEKVLLHLKARCFDQLLEDKSESPQRKPMDENSWLLLQYSPEPEIVVYQVIHYSQTIWREENQFKDVVAYIQMPGSELVLQTVVVTHGHDKDQMMAKYEQLTSFTLGLDFPTYEEMEAQVLRGHSTASLFSRHSPSLFQRAEDRDVNYEHRRVRHRMDHLNVGVQEESSQVSNAFDMMEDIQINGSSHYGHLPATTNND